MFLLHEIAIDHSALRFYLFFWPRKNTTKTLVTAKLTILAEFNGIIEYLKLEGAHKEHRTH